MDSCIVDRGGSNTAATFKVKLFVIIVNGFQPLTIITKSSTLDVTAVLDPPLVDKTRNFENCMNWMTKSIQIPRKANK